MGHPLGTGLLAGTACVIVACTGALPVAAQRRGAVRVDTVVPRVGLVLTRHTVLRPGRYRLPASDDGAPAITIRGSDVVIELRGVTLEGTDPHAAPDAGRGLAILVDGGSRVTLRGGRIRGYRTAMRATGTRDLTVEGADLSDNWRPRLWSGPAHESLADWLSYHRNDADEWRRYGAALALDDVDGGDVHDLTVARGMNGVLLTRSRGVRLWRTTIRWNSGVGIGLYRSSDNAILHNRVDFNVRGYVHGVYRRGQDSAALLLYEQSHRNVVAYNSLTHSGDGLFLWAGQSTMDSGFGGSNDNLFFGNDFSFAPTNGIEATFSRNRFIANRVEGNDHGVWGGYSHGSLVAFNAFRDNRIGVAIEHGQENRIEGNAFDGDSTAIRLWWTPRPPSDWGYPRYRDTRSRDVVVAGNRFTRHAVALRATDTQRLEWRNNAVDRVDSVLVLAGDTSGTRIALAPPSRAGASRGRPARRDCVRPPYDDPRAQAHRPRPLIDPAWAFCTDPVPRGRAGIRIGAWGPLPPGAADDRPAVLRTSPWQVRVVTWDSTSDPRADADRAFARAALFERAVASLDAVWFRPPPDAPSGGTAPQPDHPLRGVPATRWALAATATVTVPDTGETRLVAIADDGVRVWLDDVLVLDDWAPHESRARVLPIPPGPHLLRVAYYQVDGWTELQVRLEHFPTPR